jgi:hypothetical protein
MSVIIDSGKFGILLQAEVVMEVFDKAKITEPYLQFTL